VWLPSHAVSFAGSGRVRLVGDGVGDPARPPGLVLDRAGQTHHAWGSPPDEALANAAARGVSP